MRRLLIKIYIRLIRAFLSLFYDKKYLQGRLFSDTYYTMGWSRAKKYCFSQKIFFGKEAVNKKVPWPCHPSCFVIKPENIEFDVDYIDNFFNFGCYYQAIGKIIIGKGTQIAPNVGIITSNHDINDLDNHTAPEPVVIGANCWIGMNSVILPGVELGNHTIVGAGAVVTKSFAEGNCIIAGNPAKIIRNL